MSFIPFGSLRRSGAQLTGFFGLDRLSCQSTRHTPSEVQLLSHLQDLKAKGESVGDGWGGICALHKHGHREAMRG